MLDLDALEAAHAAAKEHGRLSSTHIISEGFTHLANLCAEKGWCLGMMDKEAADSIALAHNALPALLARIRELEGEVSELRSTIAACEKEVSEVYRTLTNNRFSKMNTQAVYILDDIEKHGTGGWLSQLISYLLSIRATNTCEWMELLAEHINETAEHIGDSDRVVFNGDGLTVIKGKE